MPLYNAPPPPQVVCPGERFVHFDGTETPVVGMRSIAFTRGVSPLSASDNGSTWYARRMSVGSAIQVMGANMDGDGNYAVIATLMPDANGNAFYTDVGRAAVFSAVLSAYISGPMPVLECQR